jgi:protein ImuB
MRLLRILSIFLPTLATDLAAIEQLRLGNEDHAIVLFSVSHGKEIVVRRCNNAKLQGIRIGTYLADARARVSNLLCFPYSHIAEQTTLRRLAVWAYNYSPLVMLDAELDSLDPRSSGFHMDVSGSERLFSGEHSLLAEVINGLREKGFHSRGAIAPTLGGAWALSRYGSDAASIVNKEMLKETLLPFPASALRLKSQTAASLREVNIRTLEELLRVPRPSLVERFGSEVVTRLDQTLGIIAEPLTPQRPKRLLKLEQAFDSPISDREMLKKSATSLLYQLLDKLRLNHLRSWRLKFIIYGVHASPIEKLIALSLPSSNERHLSSLLDKIIDNLPLPEDIEKVAILSERNEELLPQPTSHLSEPFSQKQPELLAEILDTLRSQLGESSVTQISTTPSHIPEKSFTFEPLRGNLAENEEKAEAVPVTSRPSILLQKPERIRALAVVPDHPPFSLRWRDYSYKVTQGYGPERIAPEWWKSQPPKTSRDYFVVQLETGAWMWVFRELETSEWFIHGLWA